MSNEKIRDIYRLSKQLMMENIYMGGRGFYQILDEIPIIGKKNLHFCIALEENKKYLLEFAPSHLTHIDLQKYLRRALFLMVLDQQKGLVTARDFSMDPTRCFVILDWIPGKNLNNVLKHVRLEIKEALWILLDLAIALQHLADFAFVHRNIHPGNIIIHETTGKAYLDGLDYLTQSDFLQTQLDNSLQYVQYTSPELAKYLISPNKSVFITPASDLYSLGAVFYHMLTGQPPFVERTNLSKWARSPYMPKVRIQFPDRAQKKICSQLLNKLMEKNFAKRWSAYELKEYLNQYLNPSDRKKDMVRWISSDKH